MHAKTEAKTKPWSGVRKTDPQTILFGGKLNLEPTLEPIHLTLPVPPSVNALFKNVNKIGRAKTAAYRAWIAEATLNLRLQARTRIEGQYMIDFLMPWPSRADLLNLDKAIPDLLQAEGVITNDSLCDGGTIYWSNDINAAHVTVTPSNFDRKKKGKGK